MTRISAVGQSNVYAFPPARTASPDRAEAERGFVADSLSSFVRKSTRSGRSATWIVGWCAFGLALASMAWVSMIGALFAAAIFFGVPWMTAAVAFAAAHVLAAALAASVGVRVSRTLLRSPQKPALPH